MDTIKEVKVDDMLTIGVRMQEQGGISVADFRRVLDSRLALAISTNERLPNVANEREVQVMQYVVALANELREN